MVRRVQALRPGSGVQRLREADAPTVVTRLDESDTVNLRKRTRSKRLQRKQSTDELVVDYIMPVISNPIIFQDHHMIMILEHLRDVVLPHIVDNAELTDIAVKLINDEVSRHKLIQERRLAEIAS